MAELPVAVREALDAILEYIETAGQPLAPPRFHARAALALVAEHCAGAERHADDTGHLHRCARVNGAWVCAAGCAVQRAEQAEARVAALEARLKELRHKDHWCICPFPVVDYPHMTACPLGIAAELLALLAPPTAGA